MKSSPPPMKSRPLTTGEIKLAKTVFGDSIDYSTVNIFDGAYIFFQPNHSGMTPNGNIYMRDCFSEDYSKENPHDRGFFIHEMTHVWQFQNKVLNPVAAAIELNLKHKFNYADAYDFHLDGKKDLTDYGMEQQAAIVQEYFMICREGHKHHQQHCRNNCSSAEKQKLFADVLAKFLKDPSYAKRAQFPIAFKSKPPKP